MPNRVISLSDTNVIAPDGASAINALIATAIAGKANDSSVVKLTGEQTIDGVKTFSSGIIVPDGTLSIAKVTGLQNTLDAKAPITSPTFTGTVSGITKSMVGLANVDNTSDINKPISTATQNALDGKQAVPVTGTKSVWQFKFTDPAVARPTVPSNVSINWVGPAGSGGTAPTNMVNDDSWDMTP